MSFRNGISSYRGIVCASDMIPSCSCSGQKECLGAHRKVFRNAGHSLQMQSKPALQQYLCLTFEVASHLMLEFVCEHNALFSTKIYILLKMVNKAVPDKTRDVAIDVLYDPVNVLVVNCFQESYL